MESIGSYLKREREFRKISLEEISAATRIKLAFLEAIEQDYYERIPAGAFLRGYLKAYAAHVGLDSADVLLRYEQWVSQGSAVEVTEKSLSESKKWHWKYFWMTLIVIIVLALAALWSYLSASA